MIGPPMVDFPASKKQKAFRYSYHVQIYQLLMFINNIHINNIDEEFVHRFSWKL